MVETFYLHLEFTGKKAWSVNLPFLCTKCGACCRLEDFLTAGQLNTQPNEYIDVQAKVKHLHEELGKMWAEDEAKYGKYIIKNKCPFLVKNSCSIYEIRPDGCRLFPKTVFGIQSSDCLPLKRFKKIRACLKRGRVCSENYFFTGSIQGLAKSEDVIQSVHLTEKQYRLCITKLHQAGVTDDELSLFIYFNKYIEL